MTEMRCQVEMWCERLFHPLLWGSWHCASRSGLPGVVSWGGQEVTVMRALFLEFVEKWQYIVSYPWITNISSVFVSQSYTPTNISSLVLIFQEMICWNTPNCFCATCLSRDIFLICWLTLTIWLFVIRQALVIMTKAMASPHERHWEMVEKNLFFLLESPGREKETCQYVSHRITLHGIFTYIYHTPKCR